MPIRAPVNTADHKQEGVQNLRFIGSNSTVSLYSGTSSSFRSIAVYFTLFRLPNMLAPFLLTARTFHTHLLRDVCDLISV